MAQVRKTKFFFFLIFLVPFPWRAGAPFQPPQAWCWRSEAGTLPYQQEISAARGHEPSPRGRTGAQAQPKNKE